MTGHHTGPGVSEFFGDAITSYDWAYVIAPDRVGTLFTLLGGQAGDDVLDLLATYHVQHGGQINDLLRGSQVSAAFIGTSPAELSRTASMTCSSTSMRK